MNIIYLIRHGKTGANEKHLYCGSSDLPLSEGGMEELGRKRYAFSADRYLTSGMLRTEQTLKLLFGEVAHETDPRFREVDFGDFELRAYEELKDDPAYQVWITGDNESNVPPNGESGEQMTARVLAAFRELEQRKENTVLVAHGGVIAAIMSSLFPGEGKNRYQWQPRPGEGYALSGGTYRAVTGRPDAFCMKPENPV